MSNNQLLASIKSIVHSVEPTATLILYGSYARGDNREDSDIDLLILLDKDKITITDENKITSPLYDLEFDTGKIISPLVFSKNEWEHRKMITPFYENIKKEGIVL